MFGNPCITTNTRGIPYLRTTGVTVGTESVTFALSFRRLYPGHLTVSIVNEIPEGTTDTLPVLLSVGGETKPLVFFGGDPVTVADLPGTGVIDVFYDPFTGAIQLLSQTNNE